MSKINILVIPSDTHGVGKFRAFGPYTHLQENYPDDFHIDIKYDVEKDDKSFEKYDVIIAHSFIHKTNGNVEKPGSNPLGDELNRINKLKRDGKIVIIDIDDYWLPTSSHPMYRNIVHNKIHLRKIALLKAASYVSTTTDIFKKTIEKELGLKNIVVFPNAIDENEEQFIPKPTESEKVRFGWLGGSSHLPDIKLMSNGLSYLHDHASDKTQLVLCGYDLRGTINEIDKKTGKTTTRDIKPEETVWYEYEKLFTKNYRALSDDYEKFLKTFKNEPRVTTDEPYIRRWTENITSYANNYNLFDISLAPLVNSKFNNNKSQLKVIEAGFHKKALIASECDPYTLDLIHGFGEKSGIKKGGNALLIPEHKNHKLWATYMKILVKEPSFVEDLGNNLHEMVMSKFTLNVVNKNRSEFIKSIINKN